VYMEWRKVFEEYDPPRTAVAEAWVHPTRRAKYASPAGLGQAFNFDLLQASWDCETFRQIITDNLGQAAASGASSTWVLSNHDVVRHATRYGLPGDYTVGYAWLRSNGVSPTLDRDLGLRRARAATMLVLALPGSAYLYQGEELGLHEVGDLPESALQDPTFERSGHLEKGRDGCRVPLPWTLGGPSYGFGEAAPHLPQPDWFGTSSVEAEEADPESTLHLYRAALRLRHELLSAEELDWVNSAGPDVVHFVRPGGWHCLTNFGTAAVALPTGDVVVTSGPLIDGQLAPDTTAWVVVDAPARQVVE
jgi:alpha-glucosidase